MRTVGRPSCRMIHEDPYKEATGIDLRTAVLDWDARGIKVPLMADRIRKTTGYKLGVSTMHRLLREYIAEAAQ